MNQNQDWEDSVGMLWESLETIPGEQFVAQMDELAAQRPTGDTAALFERACARDSTGHSDLAVPLYRQALAAGLTGIRRRRATIQLASSLRNIGQVAEGLALLEAEQQFGSDELDEALAAFLALMLVDSGREREAVAVALQALVPHLPRYQRSVGNYARLLTSNSQAS